MLKRKISKVTTFKNGNQNAYANHEYVIAINDTVSGLRAFVAIHSTVRGPAHGGTRMKYYGSEAEAIDDLLNLSKAMSYKSALAGLPYGGAKGVIMLPKEGHFNRHKILETYAKKIDQLNGLFHTGTDVGLTDADTIMMAEHCRFILGLPKPNKMALTTSEAAAKGVFYAIEEAAKFKYGSKKLAGKVIGVKGVGKLGAELIRLLLSEDAIIIAGDIDKAKLDILKSKYPQITTVEPEVIHARPMHIYAPCALGQEFTPKVIKSLRCDIIVGGANNQLPNSKAGDVLAKRGVIYIPDYIANAGGLIFVCEDLENDGFSAERVNKRLRNIPKTVSLILRRSIETHLPTNRVADTIGHELIQHK